MKIQKNTSVSIKQTFNKYKKKGRFQLQMIFQKSRKKQVSQSPCTIQNNTFTVSSVRKTPKMRLIDEHLVQPLISNTLIKPTYYASWKASLSCLTHLSNKHKIGCINSGMWTDEPINALRKKHNNQTLLNYIRGSCDLSLLNYIRGSYFLFTMSNNECRIWIFGEDEINTLLASNWWINI